MTEQTEKKKVYVKPEVKKVDLRPDEAVLGNCKTGMSAGPGSGTCQTPAACSAIGS